MGIKNHLKSIVGATFTASTLVVGSANAETTGYNGLVSNSFTGVDDYTFATIASQPSMSAYYRGDNTAIATILDNAKRLNQEVTVYIDDSTGRITHVQ